MKLIMAVLMMSWMVSGAHAGEVSVKLEAEKLTEVPNAVVLNDKLAAGGAPTARGLGQAAEQGIRTVIDLREPSKETAREKDHADAVGLKYVNIPVSVENFNPGHADKLAEVLKDPATGPALLHCATGQRAVAAWALYRNRHEGVSAAQALQEAKQKGLQKPELEAKLQTLLQ